MKSETIINCKVCAIDNGEMYHFSNIISEGLTILDIFTSTTKFEAPSEEPLYLCQNCTNIIVEFYNLKVKYQETELATKELESFGCSSCEEVYSSQDDLETHISSAHGIEKEAFKEEEEEFENYEIHCTDFKLKCDICNAVFAKKVYLKEHLEGHSEKKKYSCNYCGKAFRRRTVLVKHKRIHTNPREYICEMCGKAFNDRGTLNTHINLLHIGERKFSCPECTMTFSLKCSLIKHIRRHHQAKAREFFCTQCPLAYKDKSSLDRHIYIKHNDSKPKIECVDCGKQYTTPGNLFKHQRIAHCIKNNLLS